jgi:SPP1 gp7 family putative phage head morphogenesis protein
VSALERTRARVRFASAFGLRRPTPGRVPRQHPPDRIAASYARALIDLIRPVVRRAYDPAIAELRPIVERAAADRTALLRADAFTDAIKARAVMERAREALDQGMKQIDLEALARRVITQAAAVNKEQLGRQVKSAIGVDISTVTGTGTTTEASITGLIDAAVDANVGLIRGISAQTAQQVESAVTEAVSRGEQWGTLAEDLEQRLGFPERRAKLIARDQIGKAYGQINAARQRELGVRRFIWRTVRDERVRGAPGGKYPDAEPSHYARDGQVYEYADPPDGELPGEPIQCRCTAEPVFDDLLDDADEDPAEGWETGGAVVRDTVPERKGLRENALHSVEPSVVLGRLHEPDPTTAPDYRKRIERIKRGMESGVKFEPVVIAVRKDGSYEIISGRHRLRAALELGRRVVVRVSRGVL